MKVIRNLIREILIENVTESTHELYHATCSPPGSFVNGIDPSLAKGFGQGAGFYLFKSYITAKTHAVGLMHNGKFDKQVPCPVDKDGNKVAYIVVVDVPITPLNFDIDYEVFGASFVEFLLKNKNRIPEESLGSISIRRIFKEMGTITIITPRGSIKSINIINADSFDLGQAEALGIVAQKMAEKFPDLYEEFEKTILPSAKALKYNGKEKIIPLRIEDTEGKVVWSRE